MIPAISFGSIGRFLGGALQTVGSAASFIPGSAILRGVGSALSGPKRSQLDSLRLRRGIAGGGPAFLPTPRLPGATPTGIPTADQARMNAAASGLVCAPGHRPNKSRYFLLDGTRIDPGTRCVKVRRMEVGNSKALRRSIRRETGFAKLAKRALRGSRFKVVSASSGTRRGPRTIVESGPGSVVSR